MHPGDDGMLSDGAAQAPFGSVSASESPAAEELQPNV